MLLLAVIAPQESHSAISNRLERHVTELQSTALVGAVECFTDDDVMCFFDGNSPFATVTKTELSFTVFGGINSPSEAFSDSGEFAAIHLDRAAHRSILHAYSDRNGSWPLYFGQSGSVTAVGNDLHAVAIALGLSRLSEQAVFEFIALLYPLGRETTVEGVFRLWPGEQFEASALSQDAQKGACLITHAPPDNYDGSSPARQSLIDEIFDSLVASLPRDELRKSGVAIQVSGGLDSRLTAAAISRAGIHEPGCVTLRLADDEEVSIAREVSRRLGFDHDSLEFTAADNPDMRNAWLLTGGQVSVNAAAGNLPIYRKQLAVHAPARIVGAWPGDILIGSDVPRFAEFSDPAHTKLALRFWTRKFSSNAYRSRIRISKRASRRLRNVLLRRLTNQLGEMKGNSAAEQISRWAFMRRGSLFTFVSPARLCTNVLELTPMLAPDYVANLLRLRGDDLLDKNLYRRLIWEKVPELRDIPYHNTGVPISPNYSSNPSMSRRLRLLLVFPPRLFALAESIIARRSISRIEDASPRATDEIKHWDEMFSTTLSGPLKLTEHISADLSTTPTPHERVALGGVLLACRWTREYLESYH